MNNLKINSQGSPVTGAPQTSHGVSLSRPMVIIGAAALFFMFTGLLITTTILIANSQSAQQTEVLAAELKAARLQTEAIAAAAAAATIAAESAAFTATPDTVDEVTRSNAGIINGADLAAADTRAKAELDDAMKNSFDAAVKEAELAALQVDEMEQTLALPSCVAELQNLVETVRIGFAIGSTEPLPQDMEGARRIATTVVDCEPVMVAVEGHSDLTGQEQANMTLSWIRADAVVNRLRAEGFDVKALEPLGFGARKPIDPATTREANELNRRVQFHLAPRPGSDAAMFAEN